MRRPALLKMKAVTGLDEFVELDEPLYRARLPLALLLRTGLGQPGPPVVDAREAQRAIAYLRARCSLWSWGATALGSVTGSEQKLRVQAKAAGPPG